MGFTIIGRGREERKMKGRLKVFCAMGACAAILLAGSYAGGVRVQAAERKAKAGQTAKAEVGANAEQEVKNVEQKWLQNEENADVVQTILADDFVHVLASGFINKQDQLGYLRQHPHAFPGRKRFADLRVRVYGDVAVANGVVEMARDGQITKSNFTDVFVRREGKWLAINAQEVPAGTGSNAAHKP
jgi:hypothetical protein